MTILLMLLLFELKITVLNCNQLSQSMTMFCFCYDSSSISESSTKFSGLPHVADPQPHDEMRGQAPIHKFRDPCVPETELGI